MDRYRTSRLHLEVSGDKGYYIGDDNFKKFFTIINGRIVFDDLLESCIYRDRVQPIYDFIK